MASPRSLVVVEGEVGAYHCMARCVRRAALCGNDPLSHRNYDHRKVWLQQRLQELAGAFAVDIGSYAIMSNHIHVVLKTRPDLARLWEDPEVNRRWRQVFPIRHQSKSAVKNLMEIELADKKLMAKRRARLANVSWFMRCLLESVARRANAEDNCSGRFWEERFKCVGLLNDSAVLACSLYVDLNPVRAGLCQTPEASEFTAVFDRISQRQWQRSGSRNPDHWLSPICTKESKLKTGRRASQTPWLDMELDEYLELIDWTGRQIREDKRGAIPANIAPILERLKIKPEGWLMCVRNFGRLFRRFAGSLEALVERARRTGRKSAHGKSTCSEFFD